MEKESGALSVLYVDDELLAREMVARMLRWKGHQVHTAGDGRTGLQLFREYKPTVIVTDIIMPGMDGIEMSREVRRACSKVPIIIASAYLHDRYRFDLEQLGISQYVQKPIKLEQLAAAIESCYGGSDV
jgi:CheY-like chemotaxis protein